MVSNAAPVQQEIRRTDISRPAATEASRSRQNVATVERALGGTVGAGFIALALTRKSPLTAVLLGGLGAALLYRSTSGYCPAYGVLGINTARQGEATPEDYFNQGVHVERSYTIDKPAADLYRFWRDFTNLPSFMYYLEKVEALSDTRSRWTAKGPLGTHYSWVAEIIHDQPNELVAWKSLPNSDVDNAGTITFKESPRGTVVRVTLDYIPPVGKLGHGLAKLFGRDPHAEIAEDLRRFKRLMETGEVITTDGQPTGKCGRFSRGQAVE